MLVYLSEEGYKLLNVDDEISLVVSNKLGEFYKEQPKIFVSLFPKRLEAFIYCYSGIKCPNFEIESKVETTSSGIVKWSFRRDNQ